VQLDTKEASSEMLKYGPLHIAAYKGFPQVVEVLLNYSVQVNAKTSKAQLHCIWQHIFWGHIYSRRRWRTRTTRRHEGFNVATISRPGKEEAAILLLECGGVAEYVPSEQDREDYVEM
jgi:hypothetical protein